MLPRASGIDVCRQIRAVSAVPIIMVTAKSSEIDTVVGLEVGADDYVAKPYRIRELVARIRALLRRASHGQHRRDRTARSDTGDQVGDVSLDPDEHRVTVGGDELSLPLKEFEVLRLLLANAGRVLTREMLIDRVWGSDYVGDTKTLDVHIKRLRSKIEADPATPKRIVTIRGVGYKYDRARPNPRCDSTVSTCRARPDRSAGVVLRSDRAAAAPSKFQRLAITHAAMMGGEAAMVVALADSFFFDVDPNGARSKVLGFLLVSFAPFLFVAPADRPGDRPGAWRASVRSSRPSLRRASGSSC